MYYSDLVVYFSSEEYDQIVVVDNNVRSIRLDKKPRLLRVNDKPFIYFRFNQKGELHKLRSDTIEGIYKYDIPNFDNSRLASGTLILSYCLSNKPNYRWKGDRFITRRRLGPA